MRLPRLGCLCAAFLTATTLTHAQAPTTPDPTGTSDVPSGEVRVDDLALGKPVAPTAAEVPAPGNPSSTAPQVVAPEFAQSASAAVTPAAVTPVAVTAPEPAEPDMVTSSDSRPKRLPYNGEAAMPGYELQEQRRWWMVAAGGAMFGIGYLASLAVAADAEFDNGLGYTAVPVVGPWVALGMHDDSCPADAFDCRNLDEESLIATGLVQDIGAIVLAIALANSREVWVRSDAAWTVSPLVGRTRSGLQVSGSF